MPPSSPWPTSTKGRRLDDRHTASVPDAHTDVRHGRRGEPGVRLRLPHLCLEQQLSVALATGNLPRWEKVQSILSSYLDNNGLAAYFKNPKPNTGSPTLTAYILTTSRIADSAVPMSLLADHPNVQFNYYRGGLGTCAVEMH